MKKITAVAIAVLVATQANATEVYKNEKVTLDLNARAYAGQFIGTKDNSVAAVAASGSTPAVAAVAGEKSEKTGANNYIRIGAKGETVITGTRKAIAAYEAQFKSQTNEKDVTESADNITTRLAFAGVKDDNFGAVTFGRQIGAVGTLAGWTDVALTDSYGNDGLGVKADQYGTYRAGEMLKYSGVFSNLQVDADYKFSGATKDASVATNASSENAANMAAFGAAVSYNLPVGLSAGLGYNVSQRTASGLNDAKLWIAGIKFDDKSWYAALNYDKGTDFFYSGTKGVDITGTEAAFGYNFANGFGLMSTYNKMKQEISGGEDVSAVDYYTLGAQYKFNKNLRVMAEYRLNNKDNGVNASATKYAATTTNGIDYKNDMQLAVRYDF